MDFPRTQLIDLRNWAEIMPSIISKIASATFCGFDIETCDPDRHEGLNRFMSVNEDGKRASNKSLVFDTRRTTVTGFSIYVKGDDTAYYVNLTHADVENRLPWFMAKQILDARSPTCTTVSHNAPFELTMMQASLGYDLGKRVLCTMQLAVTAFNNDTYDHQEFREADLIGLKKLMSSKTSPTRHGAPELFAEYQWGKPMTPEQQELVMKVCAKESDSEFSYGGYVKNFAFGYGLKKLSKRFLNYEQVTFDQVLNGKTHMGQLTGDEVSSYGADDAWCCVWIMDALVEFINTQGNSEVLKTFMKQEAPMSQVYSQVWCEGIRVDQKAILKQRDIEREDYAKVLAEMKSHVKVLLPFNDEPHEKLLKYDSWFSKGYQKYRDSITNWATSPDSDDSFEQCHQVRSPVSKAWAEEQGLKESKGVNLSHYMPQRTMLYDLCHLSYIQENGKTQSDGDARDKMLERLVRSKHEIEEDRFNAIKGVLECFKKLGSIDTTIKLFLTNYLNLVDPETSRMYPTLSSQLDTRRMALSNPNVSQLPKGKISEYVRGFFLADNEDHLVISCDWNSIELVIVAEYSGDIEMCRAFSTIPYDDMHSLTAGYCLEMTPEEFKIHPDKKALRRDVGKSANFSYAFSGALGSTATVMGWSSEEHWEKVDRFRTLYSGMEAWRIGTIDEAKRNGFVELPDHHRRYRYESTKEWADTFRNKFRPYGVGAVNFANLCIKKIQTRSGNQSVNARVQGYCATMAKRTILNMNKIIKTKNYDARFMFPVHDELVFSCHKSQAQEFIKDLRTIMLDHDFFQKCLVNCSIAIGRTYQPWNAEQAPYGQIELDEANKGLPFLPKDRWEQKMTEEEIGLVINYLTN